MEWIGPFKIDELLNRCFDSSFPKPPEAKGVYLISKKAWNGQPTKNCHPLYVGSNTGKSKRLRTRIGDLIADMFGFFGTETGHHSGGQTLHGYCRKRNLNPKQLYIGWLGGCDCVRCLENDIYKQLGPSQNKRRPATCNEHKSQKAEAKLLEG